MAWRRTPPAKVAKALTAWPDERIDLPALRTLIRHKVVPVHRHTVWYYVGRMTLFLFNVQVAPEGIWREGAG